jgi:AraC-like DNA-binding protein
LLLEQVAEATGLSISRARQLFRAEMNMTLKQYADKLRMEKAREMAENHCLTIDQILDEIGAGDNSHFRRKFKRVYGRTLSEYRKFDDEQIEEESGQEDGKKNGSQSNWPANSHFGSIAQVEA